MVLGNRFRKEHTIPGWGVAYKRTFNHGVQYVHCIMRTCIMVEILGAKNVNRTKIGGNF